MRRRTITTGNISGGADGRINACGNINSRGATESACCNNNNNGGADGRIVATSAEVPMDESTLLATCCDNNAVVWR